MAIRSLHIGINYAGTQNALRGCLNDANDWAAWSKSLGGIPGTLLESDATKSNILGAIAVLLGKLTAGDWGIVTYSGHGTQIPDRSGDEQDRYDEALCPYDLNRGLLTDDELAATFSGLPQGARLFFVSDCCHSGTMTRSTDRVVGQAVRSIPYEVLCTQFGCTGTIDRIHREVIAARSLPRAKTLDMIHAAGCQDEQVSYDASFNGRARGAFTAYALESANGKPRGFTFDAWRSGVRGYLPSNRYPQSPVWNGDLSLVVPGFETPPPQPPSGPAPSVSTGRGTLILDGKTYDVTPRG